MEVLDEQALTGLSSLALLDLSKNNLRTLSAVTLRPLISLQVLRITGIFITICTDLLKKRKRFKVMTPELNMFYPGYKQEQY